MVKWTLLAALTCLAGAAQAAPHQGCVQGRTGVAHVRADVPAAAIPATGDCCTGRMQCSQFLSTVTVARPVAPEHT